MNRNHASLATLILVASCSPAATGCEIDGEGRALADEVREASGVALSREHDVLWTHNDSEGGAAIYAIDTAGNSIGRVELRDAHNRDWEDIAVARCPQGGPDGDCLFVADIGDNRATRQGIGIWIVPEPDPRTDTTAAAVFQRVVYPDGPRDAEAIAVTHDGALLVITKGREFPVSVYRSAPLAWPDPHAAPVRLEPLQDLSQAAVDLPRQVTGASLGQNGTLAVRSYAYLQFYRIGGDTLEPILPEPFPLDSLQEPQGEGVAMGHRGRVFLTSEAGPQAIAPRLSFLRCRLP